MKLIIFDFDGVIVDSFEFLKLVYQRISKILHIDIPEKDELFRELLELDYRETYKKLDIIAKDKVNLSEFTYHSFVKKHGDMIKPYPEIKEVLETLSKKYTLAIVSNNFKKDIKELLKKHNLVYFSEIFSCEDGIVKPSPDLLNKCLSHFKIEPKDAVFIGDMDGDIIAGKAAKVKTIAVTYGFHLKYRLKDANITINSPKEIIKALEGI